MTIRRVLPVVFASVVLLLLGAMIWLSAVNGRMADQVLENVLFVTIIVGYAMVGAVLASRNPSNAIGWLMLAVSASLVLAGISDEYIVYGLDTRPGSLPVPAVAALLSGLAWGPLLAVLILIVLLFPTGHVPSPRWRFLPATTVGLISLAGLGSLLAPGPLDSVAGTVIVNPLGVEALDGATNIAQGIGFIGLIPMLGAAIVALIFRYRRSPYEERQQIRWLVYIVILVAGVIAVSVLADLLLKTQGLEDALFLVLVSLIGVGVPVAIGIAVLKYRLYDLDLVIKKTVLYAIVALLLVGLFLVFASFLGSALIEAEPVAIVASVALGIVFWPAIRLARRLADRMVYGGRATPYEVLSDFSRRVGGSFASEDVLLRMATILGDAVGAREATVWLRVGKELRPAGFASSKGGRPSPVAMSGDDLPSLPADAAVEVRDQGELLGALSVSVAANDPITPSKERLIHDLAGQAGLVLRNVRLIEELRASRQRLVAAQDEARRRLERNIHDGAQQQLVALTVKLRLLEQIAGRDPTKVPEMAAQLQAETTETLEDLRDLARGIYPPLLADKGLSVALKAQARKSALAVTVEAADVGRFPQDVEAAIYFSCLEALQNVAKYAAASRITISLARSDGRLSFAVADDGVGFDVDASTYGTGLQGIADRIDALDGTFEVVSAIGTGTTVHGSIPVRALLSPTQDPIGEDQAAALAAAHASSSRSGPKADLGM
jgi:signal transduction histidine kinase